MCFAPSGLPLARQQQHAAVRPGPPEEGRAQSRGVAKHAGSLTRRHTEGPLRAALLQQDDAGSRGAADAAAAPPLLLALARPKLVEGSASTITKLDHKTGS